MSEEVSISSVKESHGRHGRLMRHIERLNQQCYVDGDHIIINAGFEYPIALNRCDTTEKRLSWSFHLTEKTWMTTEVLRRFIDLVVMTNNIPIDYAA
jgi:hypothetical protein